ncbi:hypothetical protein D9756_004556 [Leucocoprinus leucothites]|uniref:Uncharacterized protein n=1 Tax=Leucocoprinus leucothites TaxID=201217 RepID=A0A8H5LKU6_9AGAR|nr:hypothetical protein D9756_004556 [Leucoagaricus leucothites]
MAPNSATQGSDPMSDSDLENELRKMDEEDARKAAEEEERKKREAEEAEKKKREEAERHKRKEELRRKMAEKKRREAEEAEKKRKEAEEAERLQKEKEEAELTERIRLEAEKKEKERQEKEKGKGKKRAMEVEVEIVESPAKKTKTTENAKAGTGARRPRAKPTSGPADTARLTQRSAAAGPSKYQITELDDQDDDPLWMPGSGLAGDGRDETVVLRKRGNYDAKGGKIKMGGDNECGRCLRLGKNCTEQSDAGKYMCEPCHTSKQKCAVPTEADKQPHEQMYELIVEQRKTRAVQTAILKELKGIRAELGTRHLAIVSSIRSQTKVVDGLAKDFEEFYDRLVLDDKVMDDEAHEKARAELDARLAAKKNVPETSEAGSGDEGEAGEEEDEGEKEDESGSK